MRRREFIKIFVGATAAWPLGARAQQPERTRRVGMLMNVAAESSEAQPRLIAFKQALQKLGWNDGGNMRLEIRWGANDSDRDRKYASELVATAPDVIPVLAPWVWLRCKKLPALCPSYFATSPIPLAPALLIAWRGRVATLLGLACSNTR
jgi:putative ABC transport system substrate-binding protein